MTVGIGWIEAGGKVPDGSDGVSGSMGGVEECGRVFAKRRFGREAGFVAR